MRHPDLLIHLFPYLVTGTLEQVEQVSDAVMVLVGSVEQGALLSEELVVVVWSAHRFSWVNVRALLRFNT